MIRNQLVPRLTGKYIKLTPAITIPSVGSASHQISSRSSSTSRVVPQRFQALIHPSPPRNIQSLLYPVRSYSTHPVSMKEPTIHNIFEPVTGTWQYVVADASTQAAIIIDPVLNYEPATQAITTTAADELLSLVLEKGYKIEKILETHAHADHLTASAYLQHQLSQTQGSKPPIGIGKRIAQVQNLFGLRYQIGKEEYEQVFDNLFDDDESFTIGELTATALHLPGHTPDHLGYQIGSKYI